MPVKPVVFIPGFIASQIIQKSKNRIVFPPSIGDLLDKEKKKRLIRLLSGPDDPPGDIVAGEPVRHVLHLSKQAESLYDILRSYNYSTSDPNQFAGVGWDWRLAVDHLKVQDDAAAAIRRLAQTHGSKVVVLIHSTGGLVFRRLLELRPDLAASVEQVFAFGIPWAGAPKSARYLAKGEAFGFMNARLTASDVREIMSHSQAAYDLFPPDPAKTDLRSASGTPLDLFVDASGAQVGPLVDLSWIPSSSSKDYMRERAHDADSRLGRRTSDIRLPGGAVMPPVTNVVGWGVETDTRCVLDQGTVTIAGSDEGDNTVPTASASWLRGPGVRTFFLPVGVYPTAGIPSRHVRIWDSPPALELFDQVLQDKPAAPWVCAAADMDQSIDRRSDVTVRLAAQDEQGNPLPQARATFRSVSSLQPVPFQGARRANVIVKRQGLQPNAGPDLFRFVVEVAWGDGGPDRRREIPVVIRV
jgi:pimeloyl-ACP methyl ester carboxylesterase